MEQHGATPLAPVGIGPSDAEISRALDRLSKARIRMRDIAARAPRPARPRRELVERARRAVRDAATALQVRPDDPAVQKTHALAEIAEVMALRQEGYPSAEAYDLAVRPVEEDPALEAQRRAAEAELAAAQADWARVRRALGGGPSTTVDLTTDPPTLGTR